VLLEPSPKYRTTLWCWFRVTPRRTAYYPRGVIYPHFGTTVVDTYKTDSQICIFKNDT